MQADSIRAERNCDVHQQPPPLDCALVLQQLPSPDVVTPGSWGEVLRSVRCQPLPLLLFHDRYSPYPLKDGARTGDDRH